MNMPTCVSCLKQWLVIIVSNDCHVTYILTRSGPCLCWHSSQVIDECFPYRTYYPDSIVTQRPWINLKRSNRCCRKPAHTLEVQHYPHSYMLILYIHDCCMYSAVAYMDSEGCYWILTTLPFVEVLVHSWAPVWAVCVCVCLQLCKECWMEE